VWRANPHTVGNSYCNPNTYAHRHSNGNTIRDTYCYSNSYIDGHTHANGYSEPYGDSDSHAHTNHYTNPYCHAENSSNTQTSANAAASSYSAALSCETKIMKSGPAELSNWRYRFDQFRPFAVACNVNGIGQGSGLCISKLWHFNRSLHIERPLIRIKPNQEREVTYV